MRDASVLVEMATTPGSIHVLTRRAVFSGSGLGLTFQRDGGGTGEGVARIVVRGKTKGGGVGSAELACVLGYFDDLVRDPYP